MRRLFATIALTSTLLGVFAPMSAFAQQKWSEDNSYLTSLYQAQLKKKKVDPYLEKLIADERSKIRRAADQEVKALITADDQKNDQAGLTSTIARERELVSSIQDEIRDRKVDIDLLREEERRFYLSQDTGTGAMNEIRLTKTHEELLSKRAALEERVTAYEAGLSLEQDRLSKLNNQQFVAQLGTVMGILSYVLIIAGAVILDRIIRRRLVGKIEERSKRYLTVKLLSIAIYAIAIIWVLAKLFAEHPGAIASFAIIGAALAVAMQDVVKDVVGWVIIVHRHLYRLGNRITVGNHTGDVIDISLLRTTMLEVSTAGIFNAHERTGKTLHLPNSIVLREPVLNYHTTSDFMNVEMKISVTYESDWKNAESILREILHLETLPFAEKAKRQEDRRTALFYVGGDPGEPGVDIDIVGDGVLFTLSFTVPIGKRRSTVSKITRDILTRFAEERIDIAYSTVRVVGKN
jgi:small-conductance mechanosensitive channel